MFPKTGLESVLSPPAALYLVLYLFRGKDSFLLSVCVGLQKTGYRSS